MTASEFTASFDQTAPPAGLGNPLLALWLDARDRWDDAHRAVQDDDSAEAAWVHAYLHRKEGDLSNARYWYARAGRAEEKATLEEEWRFIVEELTDGAEP